MINNVVIVARIQQSDSVTHIQVPVLFQILFPSRPLHIIEQSPLCYTVGPQLVIHFKYSNVDMSGIACLELTYL